MRPTPGGHSLLVGDGVQTPFGFAKRCLIYLWVRYLVHNRDTWGLLIRKFGKVIARLSFSPKYYNADAEKAMKPLVFMHHEQ